MLSLINGLSVFILFFIWLDQSNSFNIVCTTGSFISYWTYSLRPIRILSH